MSYSIIGAGKYVLDAMPSLIEDAGVREVSLAIAPMESVQRGIGPGLAMAEALSEAVRGRWHSVKSSASVMTNAT